MTSDTRIADTIMIGGDLTVGRIGYGGSRFVDQRAQRPSLPGSGRSGGTRSWIDPRRLQQTDLELMAQHVDA